MPSIMSNSLPDAFERAYVAVRCLLGGAESVAAASPLRSTGAITLSRRLVQGSRAERAKVLAAELQAVSQELIHRRLW
jgi:hypothetical protein